MSYNQYDFQDSPYDESDCTKIEKQISESKIEPNSNNHTHVYKKFSNKQFSINIENFNTSHISSDKAIWKNRRYNTYKDKPILIDLEKSYGGESSTPSQYPSDGLNSFPHELNYDKYTDNELVHPPESTIQNKENKNQISIQIISERNMVDNIEEKSSSDHRRIVQNNLELINIQKLGEKIKVGEDFKHHHTRNYSSTSSKVDDPLIKINQDKINDISKSNNSIVNRKLDENEYGIQPINNSDLHNQKIAKEIHKEQHNMSSISNYIDSDFCVVCLIDIPLRTKHCKYCNKCVATFDHHCTWVSNCIGEKNKWLFHIFLFITSLKLALSILIVTIILFRACTILNIPISLKNGSK